MNEAARESAGAKPRYHAFDALRATAMFLVIGLHAALAYIERDIPSLLWCVRDEPTVPVFDWFCWWTMGVSNPLYFTIAGFSPSACTIRAGSAGSCSTARSAFSYHLPSAW